MAKGKSLLNQTSTKKPKKENKYSEVSPTPKKSKSDFKFKIEDLAIYIGTIIPENYGKECKIKKPKSKYNQEYYLVEFFEENKILECHCDFLLTQEEYELKQLDDSKKEEHVAIEIDYEFLDKSLQNPHCCHNQQCFAEMRCHECKKKDICIYENKGNYKKLDIW